MLHLLVNNFITKVIYLEIYTSQIKYFLNHKNDTFLILIFSGEPVLTKFYYLMPHCLI